MENPHPLKKWLARKGLLTVQFAAKSGIAFKALYNHFNGEIDPKLSTLQAIEDHTDGKVSVSKQAKWFKERK